MGRERIERGGIIIIIKRIFRAPIYCTRWEHRALTVTHTHTHTHARTHARTHACAGIDTAVKNSLEIIIKQMSLEGSFKRGGRIRVAVCLKQIVPNRWASIRKPSFRQTFLCLHDG